MHKLIEYVCDELEDLEKKAEKGNLSSSEIQYADTLAHLKKNLLKGEELYEEMDGEYSMATDGRIYDGRNRSYRGMSYARDNRGRGSDAKRDSRGRYSSEGYSRADNMIDQLHEMMEDAPDERTRSEMRKFISKMESMM